MTVDTALSVLFIIAHAVHAALVVYMLMWVAPRYWMGNIVNPALLEQSQ